MGYNFTIFKYGTYERVYYKEGDHAVRTGYAKVGEESGSKWDEISELDLRLGVSSEINIWRYLHMHELDNSGRRFILTKHLIEWSLKEIEKSDLSDDRKKYLTAFFTPALDFEEVEVGVY